MKVKNIEFSHIYIIKHMYAQNIYGTVSTKLPLKISLRLNCYNFQMVKAIDFLFSTLHTTPFLYVEIRFGVL